MASVGIEKQGRVAVVELNRPNALNAIDVETRQELARVLDQVARDQDTGAVVLAAAGKAFCSGADLKSAAANPDTSLRRTARTLLHDFQPLLECIVRMEKPVIGAVQGGAVGIGMALALSCDLLVMARNAFLKSPFVDIGLIPDGGAAWFLGRRIGYALTFEVLAEAKQLNAERCVELGLANRVVEPDALRSAAVDWAAQLAARPPVAIALTKRMARLSMTTGLAEAMTMEAELQTFCVATEDSREAIAAFSEKRKPSFKGR